MEVLAALPEWLGWVAAGAAGAIALGAIANIIETTLDLEAP